MDLVPAVGALPATAGALPDGFGHADFAGLIEAAYSPGADDEDWLERIVAFARPALDRGLGVVGCLFEMDGSGSASVRLAVGGGALPARPKMLAEAFLPAVMGRVGSARAGTVECAKEARASGLGARVCAGVFAADGAPGRRPRMGCALLAPQRWSGGLSRESAAVWSAIGRHLGDALRMRRAFSIQEVWRGLLSGRWTLVDHFDAGGRRFVVARGKPTVAPRPPLRSLSAREREACSRAACGLANKVIAGHLGVSVSTVGQFLSRASRKLRCRSREDLIRAFFDGQLHDRALDDTWDEDPSAPL